MNERILDNKYIINKVIGTGGMSIVYSGFSMDTGEEVAIKILRPEYLEDDEFIKRFKKEAKIAQQLNHRNIIKTMDIGEDEGLPYIIMEYVRGNTLKELIKNRGKLTNEEAVKIGVKISEALFYAHSTKLIHRDIKPQNVLLNEKGALKVADFGIARIQDQGTVTLGGSNILGSVHYLSPEQARGLHITKKADIYSLGICLYEMVTGEVPFEGDSPVSVAIKHIQETAISPRLKNHKVSVALEEVIEKAISKEPEARYDTAFELGQDLKRALEHPEGGFVKKKVIEHGDTMVNIPKITREMELAALKDRERLNNTLEQKKVTTSRSYERSRRRRSVTSSIVRLMVALIVIVGIIVTMILIGRSIFINNSVGELQEVPRVMGQSEEIASEMIREAGLVPSVVYESNELISKTIVLSQNPLPTEKLLEGSEVVITVSLGQEMITVPNVLNRDYTEAASIIELAGLKVGDVTHEDSEAPNDYIIGQNPAADEVIPLNEPVHLVLSKQTYDTEQSMPDVMLLGYADATALLADSGYGIYQVVDLNANESEGTVLKQAPEAGTVMESNTQITLWVSNGLGAEYVKEYKVLFSVTKNETHVIIEFVDGDTKTRYYDEILNKNEYEIVLLLKSDTWGEKELFVYLNGEIYSSDRIYLTVDDG